MKQEFSLAHLTVLGCAPPEMTYIAARAGYDYVSIRPIFMGLPGEPNYALAENRQMLRQTKTALASTGVRVHDIELARIFEGVDLEELPARDGSLRRAGREGRAVEHLGRGARLLRREVRRALRSREAVRADGGPRVRADRSRTQPGRSRRRSVHHRTEQRGPDGRHASLPSRGRRSRRLSTRCRASGSTSRIFAMRLRRSRPSGRR